MSERPPDAVDARVVRALSHPTRRRVLELLHGRETACPAELAEELEVPLGTVSYHVRTLERLGFIEVAARIRRRGAIEHRYRVREALDGPSPALEALGRDGGSAAAAARLLAGAHAALAGGGFDRVGAGADGRALRLDARGAAEARAALAHAEERIAAIAERSAARLAARDGAPAPSVAVAATVLVALG